MAKSRTHLLIDEQTPPFGIGLAWYMKLNGIAGIADLSRRTGVDHSTIYRMFEENYRGPSAATLSLLASKLGFEDWEFLKKINDLHRKYKNRRISP